MSGNPFRKPAPNRVVEKSTLDSEVPGRISLAPQTSTKRGTFQTPPGLPEDIYTHVTRRENDNGRLPASFGRSLSPAFNSSWSIEGKDGKSIDTITAPFDVFAQAAIDTRWDPAESTIPALKPAMTGVKAPYNPFARTLATNEAPFQDQSRQSTEEDAPGTQNQETNGRRRLDVDAFKNMLMTGNAGPSSVSGPQSTIPTRPPVTFSNGASRLDTLNTFSLPQRQSLFDQSFGIHPESPRSSFDDYRSSDQEDFGNEDSSLMGPVESRPQEIAPRAPPKPRAKGPQTVSFAEFDQSIPPDFHAPGPRMTPPINPQLHSILRPSVSRSHSDLNKPLPPPPQPEIDEPAPPASMPEQVPAAISAAAAAQQAPQLVISSTIQEESASKKVPPPPPVSRRQGPTGQARPPITSNTSQDANMPNVDHITTLTRQTSEDTSTKSAPPPPPTRRAHPPTTAHTASSPSYEAQADSSLPPATTLSASAQAAAVAAAAQTSSSSSSSSPILTSSKPSNTTVPPPPPRRHPSRTGSNFSNTRSNSPASSIRSSENFRLGPTSSHSSTSAAAVVAPAPPTSRRGLVAGASNRNGTDFLRRHGSAQSLDSERAASVSSLQQQQQQQQQQRAEEVESGYRSVSGGASSSASATGHVGTAAAATAAAALSTEDSIKPDLLADMTAFQAEIDALMARGNGGGGGGKGLG